MKNIVLAAINKNKASVSVFILLSLWGIYALGSLPKATEPDVQFPGVGVSVVYEGVSPKIQKDFLLNHLKLD